MKYPNFLNKGDTIGVCAPSAGVGKNLQDYLESIKVLKNEGYRVIETKSVRKKGPRSTSAKGRAKEFHALLSNPKVDAIIFATGGDYMFEMMPYVNYDKLIDNPIWLMGYSDPTNILLDVTCFLDIATLYGFNAGSYRLNNPKWQQINLEYLKGNIIKQKSYSKYQTSFEKWNNINEFKNDVKWISKNDVDISGRLIGGCFEIIKNHLGTYLDNMSCFVSRYAEDGIIWYFDIYNCSVLDFYLGLLQMKYAGLFINCKGVLIGRVAIPNIENTKFDYIKAADKALGNIPHIMEMDIGHTSPAMTMINGAICHAKCRNGKGEISFKLK